MENTEVDVQKAHKPNTDTYREALGHEFLPWSAGLPKKLTKYSTKSCSL